MKKKKKSKDKSREVKARKERKKLVKNEVTKKDKYQVASDR